MSGKDEKTKDTGKAVAGASGVEPDVDDKNSTVSAVPTEASKEDVPGKPNKKKLQTEEDADEDDDEPPVPIKSPRSPKKSQLVGLFGFKNKPPRELGPRYFPNHSYYNDPTDFKKTLEMYTDDVLGTETISLYEEKDVGINVAMELQNIRLNMIAFWLFGLFTQLNWFLKIFGQPAFLLNNQAFYENFGRMCPVGEAIWPWMLVFPGACGKLLFMFFLPFSESTQIILIIIMGTAVGMFLAASIQCTELTFTIALAASKFLSSYAELFFLCLSTKYDGTTLLAFISGTGFCPLFVYSWFLFLQQIGVNHFAILAIASFAWTGIGISYLGILRCPNPKLVRPPHHNHNTCGSADAFEEILPYSLYLLHVAIPFMLENACSCLIVVWAAVYQFRATDLFDQESEISALVMSFLIGNQFGRSFGNNVNLLLFYWYVIYQCVNSAMVLYDTIYIVIPHLAQMMTIYLVAGLVSGSAYRNVYCWLSVKMPTGSRRFGIGFVSLCGDIGFGICFFFLPMLHKMVCNPQNVSRMREFMYYFYYDWYQNSLSVNQPPMDMYHYDDD